MCARSWNRRDLRTVAERMHQIQSFFAASVLVGLIAAPARPSQRTGAGPEASQLTSVRRTPNEELTAEEIFQKLLDHNRRREARLQGYSEVRTYVVTNRNGEVHAVETVRMEYRAPDTKSFATIREEGSRFIRGRVFKGLMDSEVEAAAGRSHRDSSITPTNYVFYPRGIEDTEECQCFVVQAVPRRKDKYLFEGTIWIDAHDFAIVKIAGHPARNPSFWIKRADFVRSYQKIGEFWLPLKDQTSVEVRIFGDKEFTIDHSHYVIDGAETSGSHVHGAAQGGAAFGARNGSD